MGRTLVELDLLSLLRGILWVPHRQVPADKTETERLIHRSKHYVLVDGNLMRKSAKEGILQKCITQEEGVKLLSIRDPWGFPRREEDLVQLGFPTCNPTRISYT